MRILFSFLFILQFLTPDVAIGADRKSDGNVSVHGYTRTDGTYVSPHIRSRPDGNLTNNWSTLGNVNPYTGSPGTKTHFQNYSGKYQPSKSGQGASYYADYEEDDEFDINDIEQRETLAKAKARQSAKHRASISPQPSSAPEMQTTTRQAYKCSNSSGKVGVGTGRLSQDNEYSSFLKKMVHAGEFVIFKYEFRGKEYWFKQSKCTRL